MSKVLRCKVDHTGSRYWVGVCTWDVHYPGDRLRTIRSSRVEYRDEASARRWARRHNLERFPTEPGDHESSR